jgi:hypothetical protein
MDCSICPLIDLVGIVQYADALLEQLLCLTLWLATSMRSGRHDVAMVPAKGQLIWAQVKLSMDKVGFDSAYCHQQPALSK